MTEDSTKNRRPIRPFAQRERQILDLLIQGMSSKEIAAAFDPPLSPRTIDHRIAGMCDKAGVWSRRELMVLALRSEPRAA